MGLADRIKTQNQNHTPTTVVSHPESPEVTLLQTTAPTETPTRLRAREAQQGKRYRVSGREATFMVGVSGRGADTLYSFSVSGAVAPILVAGDVEVEPLPDGAPVLATVLPPDAPASNPAALTAAAPPVTPPSAGVTPQNEQEMTAALSASIAATATPETAPTTEPRARRGRPRKNLIQEPATTPTGAATTPEAVETPRTLTVVPPPPASTPSPAPAPAPTPTSKTDDPTDTNVAPSGIYLYFGCTPLGVLTSTLVSYVNQIDESIRSVGQLTCPDVRASNSQDYGYGKWKGYFAQMALMSPPPPGHYVVTSGDERVETVASALQALATLVVRS